MESPAGAAGSGPVLPGAGGDRVKEWTTAVSVACSLLPAAGGGPVFSATGGQLAAGAVMIALTAARARQPARTAIPG